MSFSPRNNNAKHKKLTHGKLILSYYGKKVNKLNYIHRYTRDSFPFCTNQRVRIGNLRRVMKIGVYFDCVREEDGGK